MQVMTLHEFFDTDIEMVLMGGHPDVREIVLREGKEGSLLISKQDAIALAKDFGLVVYEKAASL